MKKNELIGFGVLVLGGIVVLKFLGGIIATILKVAILGGLVYFGYRVFGKK